MIDQGSMLYGVRSDKYPNTCCYGIIISASCDIANCKVPKFYYLAAINAKEWFSTEVGYNQAYGDKKKSLLANLESATRKHSLSASLLQTFSESDFYHVIEDQIKSLKEQNNIKNIYEKYKIFCQAGMDCETRKIAIRTDNDPAKKFLEKVGKGEILHYYYLPQDAYRGNKKKNLGLIVDLQEIEILSIEDAQKIQSPGIDYMLLPHIDEKEQKRLKKHYWLETENDFVVEDGIIASPWREHLMQRFSNGFIRIGVNGATVEDYSNLVNEI